MRFILKKKDLFALFCTAYVTVMLVFCIFGDRGLLTSLSLWQQKNRLAQNINDLQQDIQNMQEEVLLFHKDPVTIEGYARERLHMHRDNEMEILLP